MYMLFQPLYQIVYTCTMSPCLSRGKQYNLPEPHRPITGLNFEDIQTDFFTDRQADRQTPQAFSIDVLETCEILATLRPCSASQISNAGQRKLSVTRKMTLKK